MDKARKSANWKTPKVILDASDVVSKCSRYILVDPFKDLSKVNVKIRLTQGFSWTENKH